MNESYTSAAGTNATARWCPIPAKMQILQDLQNTFIGWQLSFSSWSFLQIEVSQRFLFLVLVSFGENALKHHFNVVGSVAAFEVWRALLLHASIFSCTRLHRACTSCREDE